MYDGVPFFVLRTRESNGGYLSLYGPATYEQCQEFIRKECSGFSSIDEIILQEEEYFVDSEGERYQIVAAETFASALGSVGK